MADALTVLTDREIKDLMTGYSDETIGEIIGKTRQAVNKGLNTHARYLSKGNWLAIVDHLRKGKHPALQKVLVELTNAGIDLSDYSELAPVAPVPLDSLTLKRLDVVLPDAILFMTRFPACFTAFANLILKAAETHEPEISIYAGADISADFFSGLLSDHLGETADTEKLGQAYAWSTLKDPSKFPTIFRATLDDNKQVILTCIQDRFLEVDRDFYSKILMHAIAPAKMGA